MRAGMYYSGERGYYSCSLCGSCREVHSGRNYTRRMLKRDWKASPLMCLTSVYEIFWKMFAFLPKVIWDHVFDPDWHMAELCQIKNCCHWFPEVIKAVRGISWLLCWNTSRLWTLGIMKTTCAVLFLSRPVQTLANSIFLRHGSCSTWLRFVSAWLEDLTTSLFYLPYTGSRSRTQTWTLSCIWPKMGQDLFGERSFSCSWGVAEI